MGTFGLQSRLGFTLVKPHTIPVRGAGGEATSPVAVFQALKGKAMNHLQHALDLIADILVAVIRGQQQPGLRGS